MKGFGHKKERKKQPPNHKPQTTNFSSSTCPTSFLPSFLPSFLGVCPFRPNKRPEVVLVVERDMSAEEQAAQMDSDEEYDSDGWSGA